MTGNRRDRNLNLRMRFLYDLYHPVLRNLKSFLICFAMFSIILPGITIAGSEKFEIAFTKGVYRIKTEEYTIAISNLKEALRLEPEDEQASLYLGIAYSRSGDYVKAKEILTHTLEVYPDNDLARYELAAALYATGERVEAKRLFREILSKGSKSDISAGARSYLGIFSTGDSKRNRFSLEISTGAYYDTNVIFEPSNPGPAGEKKADWALFADLDGKWSFLDTDGFDGELKYQFYRSYHKSLADFDEHAHTAGLSLSLDLSENVELSAEYEFEYFIIRGDLYSRIHTITFPIRFLLSPDLLTELEYSHEFRDFSDSETNTGNAVRSGNYDSAGLTQFIRLTSPFHIYLGYRYDRDSTEVDYWDYEGDRATFGATYRGERWKLYFLAEYFERDYRGVFPGSSTARRDRVQEYSLYISRYLAKNFSLNLYEYIAWNASNLDEFEYRRNISEILLEVKLW